MRNRALGLVQESSDKGPILLFSSFEAVCYGDVLDKGIDFCPSLSSLLLDAGSSFLAMMLLVTEKVKSISLERPGEAGHAVVQ